MKSFFFSSVLGIGVGIGLGSQILKSERLDFTTESGPAVSIVTQPMKLSAAGKRPMKFVAPKKHSPVKRRVVKKRPRKTTTEPFSGNDAAIATLVSRGLGQ